MTTAMMLIKIMMLMTMMKTTRTSGSMTLGRREVARKTMMWTIKMILTWQ